MLHEYFRDDNNWKAHPNGSKNLAIVVNMVLLVLLGDDGRVTRN